jgi:hypothetical protein
MHSFTDDNAAYWLCVLWFAMLTTLFLEARSKPSSGLTLVYAAQLSVLHLPGAMLLLIPWYEYYPRSWTYLGFQMTTFGLAAFVAGVLFSRAAFPVRLPDFKNLNPLSVKRFGAILIGIGLGFTILTSQAAFLFQIPSITALLAAIWLLGAPGLCLYMHGYVLNGEKMPMHAYLIALAFPALTVLFLGFIGFGITYVIFIIGFSLAQKYFPKKLFILAPFLVYAGLSFFVNYMQQRDNIRQTVWGDQTMGVRSDAIAVVFRDFQWFDKDNFFHLRIIDDRLNQNWIVGAAIEALDSGRTEYLNGESLALATVAWVPRVIWINKPSVAGSGDLVARLTGITFDAQTSVGLGHVLELYGNFGATFAMFGMFVLGFFLRGMDRVASAYLMRNNLVMWLRWVIPGIALTNVGGQFAETISGAAAFVILGYLLQFFITRLTKGLD